MRLEEIVKSRALRISASVVVALVLASEFTMMFGPTDLAIHGTIAALGIAISIAFALKKTWAEKLFPLVSGYCAVKYSFMPAIYAFQGNPWGATPTILLIVLSGIWTWLWICFLSYSKGARIRTLLIAGSGLIVVYGFQFLLLVPKGGLRALSKPPKALASDANASFSSGVYTARFLSSEFGIEEPDSVELLMRAPTFRFLMDMPVMGQREQLQHDLSKDEVQQALRGLKVWDELHDLWRKENESPRPTIAARAADFEQFARNYLYRTFYWVEANKLLKQGSLSKQEIDDQSKQIADQQVREILKQTDKKIW